MDSRPYDVLIVEDDAVIRYYVNLCLSEAGLRCLEARDGKDALEKLGLLPEGSLPGVALVDVRMPILDGFSFATEARRRNYLQSMRLLFVTSEQLAPSVSLESETFEVFTKPHNMEILIPYVQNLTSTV